MSDYLDRMDEYYSDYSSHPSREQLEEFKSKCQKTIKRKVYRFRYSGKKIEIYGHSINRNNEVYEKDNAKYFIGDWGDICSEIIPLDGEIYSVKRDFEFYSTTCDSAAIRKYKQCIIDYYNEQISNTESAEVLKEK